MKHDQIMSFAIPQPRHFVAIIGDCAGVNGANNNPNNYFNLQQAGD